MVVFQIKQGSWYSLNFLCHLKEFLLRFCPFAQQRGFPGITTEMVKVQWQIQRKSK